MKKSISGFTIVELLIVIVVIAVLASITVIAFNGAQQRSREASLSSNLAQVAKKLRLYIVENDNYPNDLISVGIKGSSNTTYQYIVNNSVNPKTFCVTATSGGISHYVNHSGTPTAGSCSGHYANLAPHLSQWTVSGGTTYDSGSGEIRLNAVAGGANSPLIRVEGSSAARITINAIATQPSPNTTPNSSVHFSSAYFAADGTTSVNNSIGWTGNGDAACVLTLSVWRSCSWQIPTGSNVVFIRYRLESSPAQYTSDNTYRDVQVVMIP